jgi:HK97 family phage major capsid protein
MHKLKNLPARAAGVIGYRRDGSPIYEIAGGSGETVVDVPAPAVSMIDTLRERRTALTNDLEAIGRAAVNDAGEARKLDPAEQARYDSIQAEVLQFDERIADLIENEQRDAIAAQGRATLAAMAGARIGQEQRTYERAGEASFFRDLYYAQGRNEPAAWERMNRHMAEVRVDARGRSEYRDLTRTDGAIGEFVPPLWMIDEYAALARASRITANLCRNLPLPGGTDTLIIPRITTGSAVAFQADNGVVQKTDMASTSVSAAVTTVAGQEDVALQLLEQSPLSGGIDELIFADLAADYDAKLDVGVLNGSGASPAIRGIINTVGIGAIAYTDATPTVPELYLPLAQAVSNVATTRLLPPNAIVMAPRRWYWMTAALDASNRPLVVPIASGVYMAIAVLQDVQTGGPVGMIQGLPVYLDANMPLLLGAGTEDKIIVARFVDDLLFEGTPRMRVLGEVLSNTLEVRLQYYRYVAFTAGRYPSANAVIGGTGLIAPAGF